MNSNSRLIAPSSPRIPKWLIPGVLAFSALGFVDAAYLAAEHFTGSIPPCSIVQGCETVLTSPYAVIWGIPVALFGALFYLASFLLMILYKETEKEVFLYALAIIASAAFLSSLWFVYVQLFILNAICLYCMTSAGTSTLIFILTTGAFFKIKKEKARE